MTIHRNASKPIFVHNDRKLFAVALTDTAQRPLALANLRDVLSVAGGLDHVHPDGWSNALLACATHGWREAVELLLAAGADVHVDGDLALRSAAWHGHLPVVECLLAAGADVHAMNDAALHWAAHGNHLPVVERLLAAGTDVHTNNDGALCWAAEMGHLPVVEHLLAAGADVHARQEGALRQAVQNGHVPVVQRLLSAGADVHADNDGVLRLALENDRKSVARILLHHGAHATVAMRKQHSAMALRCLDAMAADIPADQRRVLIVRFPRHFHALRALEEATCRQLPRDPATRRP